MFVFDFVIDMDFSAMYPHIIVSHNIERHTMIGKLVIEGFDIEPYDHIFVNETIYDNSEADEDDDDELVEEPAFLKIYDAGRDFVEGYLTDDIGTMGSRWFNLPSYDKVYEEFVKKFDIKPRRRISFNGIISKIKEKFNIAI
jgi:hypothetical protein